LTHRIYFVLIIIKKQKVVIAMSIGDLIIPIIIAAVIVVIGSFIFAEGIHISAIKRAKRNFDRVR
jgi:uncharacterized integral membrane protein